MAVEVQQVLAILFMNISICMALTHVSHFAVGSVRNLTVVSAVLNY